MNFINGKLSRADPSKFIPIYFTWDTESRMMVSCNEPEKRTIIYDPQTIREILNEFELKGVRKIPSVDFKKRYSERMGISDDRAKKQISEATKDGVMNKEGPSAKTLYFKINNEE